jgi:uroporphyrinogen decarboxylase
MYADSGAWRALMELLVSSLAEYLTAQIAAGCQAVQIFDSWAGALSPADYRQYVLPHLSALIAALPAGTPVISFLTGNPSLVPIQAEAGGQVIGLDWRCDLPGTWDAIGGGFAVQGNLDPILLFADQSVLLERAGRMMDSVAGRDGYIFNLGHGVLPGTPVDNVKRLVEFVHEHGAA